MQKILIKYTYHIALALAALAFIIYFLTYPTKLKKTSSKFIEFPAFAISETIENSVAIGFADTLSAANNEYIKALKELEKGNYSEAIELLNNVLIKAPDKIDAVYYLGLSHLYSSNFEKSLNSFEKVMNSNDFVFKDDSEWHAMIALSEKNQDQARSKLNEISNSSSKYSQAAKILNDNLIQIKGKLHAVKSYEDNNSHPRYSLIIQPQNNWWQDTSFRYGALLLLPICGLSLIFWKKRIENKIEKEVKLRTADLEKEKLETEELLYNILPAETARELQSGESTTKRHEMVTVLFCDFEGFTNISEKLQPEELVKSLATCFEAFDKIIEEEKLEKIKTVGDCYICAGGINAPSKRGALNIINAGIKMINFLKDFNKKQVNNSLPVFNGRIGVNTGPVVAGIVGIKKYAYDIWGDTVNIAARMEQESEGGKINVSRSTYDLINDQFNCEHRGKVEAKGKGAIDMYFVKGNE